MRNKPGGAGPSVGQGKGGGGKGGGRNSFRPKGGRPPPMLRPEKKKWRGICRHSFFSRAHPVTLSPTGPKGQAFRLGPGIFGGETVRWPGLRFGALGSKNCGLGQRTKKTKTAFPAETRHSGGERENMLLGGGGRFGVQKGPGRWFSGGGVD